MPPKRDKAEGSLTVLARASAQPQAKGSLASRPLTKANAKATAQAKAKSPQKVAVPAEEPTMPANALRPDLRGPREKTSGAYARLSKVAKTLEEPTADDGFKLVLHKKTFL